MSLSDIAILNIHCVDYHFIISGISKSEDINLLQNIDLTGKVYIKMDNKFSWFYRIFLNLLNNPVPLKKKILRGSNSPFLTKTVRKDIRIRSRPQNCFNKTRSDRN